MRTLKLNDIVVMYKVSKKAYDPVRGVSPKFKLTLQQAARLFKKNKGLCNYTNLDYVNLGDVTFERVNPLEGYVEGNTILCSRGINTLKGTTIDVFLHNDEYTDETKLKVLKSVTKRFETYLKNKAEKVKGSANEQESEKG